MVLGPAAVGLIIGAVWVGQYGMKYLKGSLIMAGILSIGVILTLISFLVGNLLIVVLLLLFMGIFNSFISVPANTILQGESDDKMRGRIYGVLTSLTGGISILPVIFSGILADVVGVGGTLTTLGLIVLGIGFYQLIQRKRMI
jgi:DHA3 family macrolide efflux protein-like MFS transporter